MLAAVHNSKAEICRAHKARRLSSPGRHAPSCNTRCKITAHDAASTRDRFLCWLRKLQFFALIDAGYASYNFNSKPGIRGNFVPVRMRQSLKRYLVVECHIETAFPFRQFFGLNGFGWFEAFLFLWLR